MTRPLHRLALAALLAAANAAAWSAERIEYLNSGVSLPTDLPFSEAVRVDDTLYLSGQIGVQPDTLTLVEGGMAAQAHRTLANIRATLEAHGFSLRDVVKCTVMLADIDEWGTFNEIYQQYFSPPYPARSALGANGLALGARVELECLAVQGRREAPTTQTPDPGRAPVDPDEADAERVYRRPSRG